MGNENTTEEYIRGCSSQNPLRRDRWEWNVVIAKKTIVPFNTTIHSLVAKAAAKSDKTRAHLIRMRMRNTGSFTFGCQIFLNKYFKTELLETC